MLYLCIIMCMYYVLSVVLIIKHQDASVSCGRLLGTLRSTSHRLVVFPHQRSLVLTII